MKTDAQDTRVPTTHVDTFLTDVNYTLKRMRTQTWGLNKLQFGRELLRHPDRIGFSANADRTNWGWRISRDIAIWAFVRLFQGTYPSAPSSQDEDARWVWLGQRMQEYSGLDPCIKHSFRPLYSVGNVFAVPDQFRILQLLHSVDVYSQNPVKAFAELNALMKSHSRKLLGGYADLAAMYLCYWTGRRLFDVQKAFETLAGDSGTRRMGRMLTELASSDGRCRTGSFAVKDLHDIPVTAFIHWWRGEVLRRLEASTGPATGRTADEYAEKIAVLKARVETAEKDLELCKQCLTELTRWI